MDFNTATINTLSTRNVPKSMRFEYWANVLSEVIIPMSVESENPRDFSEDLTEASLGPISVIRNRGGAHTSRRTARDLDRSGDRSYHLLASLRGSWELAHRGRFVLGPGDLVLTDSRYEHEINIRSKYEIVHLKLSENWVDTWLPDPEAFVGQCISKSSTWGRTLAQFVIGLSPETAVGVRLPRSLLADHIGALLALHAGAALGPPTVDRRLRVRVLDCIRQRCFEPGLSADDVAASLNVMPHDLHAALATLGKTFAGELVEAKSTRRQFVDATQLRRSS